MKQLFQEVRFWQRIRVWILLLLRKSRSYKDSSQNLARLTWASFLAQLNLNQDIPFLFVAICVGLVTGYVAVIFHEAIKIISSTLFEGYTAIGLPSFNNTTRLILLPLIPAFGGLIAGLYNTYVVKSRPEHGLASVIKAVAQKEGRIRK